MNLSINEKKILELIEQDPFLSQQDIAKQIGSTRSTVASAISSLIHKKRIVGRAYVINETPAVCCIGGMNVDRKYSMTSEIVPKTSNPVTSSLSVGGVARNIAENLGRLGQNVHLLSVAGYDQDYEWIKQKTEQYVNMRSITQLRDNNTSTYSAILDQAGEMQLAISDMSICDQMDLAWIQAHKNLILRSQIVVIDLNLPQETVAYIIDLANQHQIDLVVVPVSSPKMVHLPSVLQGVTWLIVNQDESETYFDFKCQNASDIALLADKWLDRGVEQVIITRGTQSSYYANQSGIRYEFIPPYTAEVVDVTGAGDSFAAGLVYGLHEGNSVMQSIEFALTNSYYTVQTDHTVRLELTADKLKAEYHELKERGVFNDYKHIIN